MRLDDQLFVAGLDGPGERHLQAAEPGDPLAVGDLFLGDQLRVALLHLLAGMAVEQLHGRGEGLGLALAQAQHAVGVGQGPAERRLELRRRAGVGPGERALQPHEGVDPGDEAGAVGLQHLVGQDQQVLGARAAAEPVERPAPPGRRDVAADAKPRHVLLEPGVDPGVGVPLEEGQLLEIERPGPVGGAAGYEDHPGLGEEPHDPLRRLLGREPAPRAELRVGDDRHARLGQGGVEGRADLVRLGDALDGQQRAVRAVERLLARPVTHVGDALGRLEQVLQLGLARVGQAHVDDDAHSASHRSSSATTGTWSEGLSQPRTSLWISTPSSRSAAWGESSRWSMRMPWFRR